MSAGQVILGGPIGPLLSTTILIPVSQISLMTTTASYAQLVPPQGAGTFICPVIVFANVQFQSVAWSGAGNNLILVFSTNGTSIVGSESANVLANGDFNANSSRINFNNTNFAINGGTTTLSTYNNVGLWVRNNSASAPTLGNSPIQITTWYTVATNLS